MAISEQAQDTDIVTVLSLLVQFRTSEMRPLDVAIDTELGAYKTLEGCLCKV